jgi:hypothetical protein
MSRTIDDVGTTDPIRMRRTGTFESAVIDGTRD